MAQNLDPKSDGRGVLQFKTGLMSVIKVIVASFQDYIAKGLGNLFRDLIIYLFFSCEF